MDLKLSILICRSAERDIPVDVLFEKMRYLGRLYDHDSDHLEEIQDLHQMLSGGNSSFDVTDIMKRVN